LQQRLNIHGTQELHRAVDIQPLLQLFEEKGTLE